MKHCRCVLGQRQVRELIAAAVLARSVDDHGGQRIPLIGRHSMAIGHEVGVGVDDLVEFNGNIVLWDRHGYYYDVIKGREPRGTLIKFMHSEGVVRAFRDGSNTTVLLDVENAPDSATLFDKAVSDLLSGPPYGIALHVRASSFATFSRMPIPMRTALWANTVHTAERRV